MRALPGLLLLLAAVPTSARGESSRLLSAFRDGPKGTCTWSALTAEGQATPLADVPSPCSGLTVAVTRKGDHAVVRLQGDATDPGFSAKDYPAGGFPKDKPAKSAKEPKDGLWRLDLASSPAKVTAVPPPPDGRLERVGFDESGRLVALTEVDLPDVKTKRVTPDGAEPLDQFTYKGETFEAAVGAEGLKAVALAWRLSPAGTWEKTEAKATTTGWDYAAGVDVLDAARIWVKPSDVGDGWETSEVDKVQEAKLVKALASVQPKTGVDTNDGWVRLHHTGAVGAPHGELLVWQVSGEFAHDTGLLLYRAPLAKEYQPLPGLGYTAGDLVTLTVTGDLCLVTTPNLRAHPRVYDLRSGKLVLSSDKDVGVTLWSQIVE